MTRIIGIDPGLRFAGWGIIDSTGNQRTYIAAGEIMSPNADIGAQFLHIYNALTEIIETFKPKEAAIEKTFVNQNARDTLKLGQARGIAILAPAAKGLKIAEYQPNTIKKTVTGNGHAKKKQIHLMIKHCLPKCDTKSEHAHDALATALTHAIYRNLKTP